MKKCAGVFLVMAAVCLCAPAAATAGLAGANAELFVVDEYGSYRIDTAYLPGAIHQATVRAAWGDPLVTIPGSFDLFYRPEGRLVILCYYDRGRLATLIFFPNFML